MDFLYDCKNFAEIYKDDITKKFTELFSEFEDCDKVSQKQNVYELNRLIDEMNKEEFRSVFNNEMFDKINKMIEEKKMDLKNAILLLKQVGYCNELNESQICGFYFTLLSKSFEKMIFEEEEKKEEKDEKLLVDLCECNLLLGSIFSSKLISICVPCLLKVASDKEENEEAQKEVEMALLALNNIGFCKVEQELFLDKITEIIKYLQEHRNLTRLAYQSVWQFLINQLRNNRSWEYVVANELHFAREAIKELEELSKCVDWKRQKDEEGVNETKEEIILKRWLKTLLIYFRYCQLRNEEFVKLIGNIAQILRTAKNNFGEICDRCLECFDNSVRNKSVEIEHFLESGAIDVIFEMIVQSNIDLRQNICCLSFIKKLCKRLKEKKASESYEAKRKEVKRKLFEKLEEYGYEDWTIGFNYCFVEEDEDCYFLIENLNDYFVYY
ncbi:uncharacterized protein MONOS_2787 [Monocercomonoides exilis]|uniref:uncharacterized protein n=1 Tax=Monocercomonoides exilis TaxID=2049356 RepID=UPI003559E070|nr:hypothetical protein MONOS_2787 [Monocercomonoides exilis]